LHNESEAYRRPLHGHIRHLKRLAVDMRGFYLWQAEVAPWLWFLTHSVDCRIYQHLSIPEILRSVFDEYGVKHYDFRLHGEHPKLDFCVQYRESAFAFVSRLMEHIGICYWFEHDKDQHLLVLADRSPLAKYTTPRQVTLAERGDLGEIQEFRPSYEFRPGSWALSDFDFEVPTKSLHTRERTVLDIDLMKRFEVFDYPGSYLVRDRGSHLTRLRLEAEEARHHRISGTGSWIGIEPGKRFVLAPNRGDRSANNETYFITEVRHSAREPGYFSGEQGAASYCNQFCAIPGNTPYRPERLTQWPVVEGPQTATVVGPANENIHTDQYGRVRVLFHWDRRGKRDDYASCWIRVSQHAAGSHWGGLAIPHVGQEVVVAFLEGDPDRPLVVGRVHNGNNMPPLILPRDRHKTIIRDHGDNRLIMHGKPGQERLSLVSPKNINFVAMRSPAKPLSAQTIDNISFDDNTDPSSLKELLAIYNELKNPVSPPQGQPTPKAGDPLPVAPPNPKDLSATDVPEADLDNFGGGAGLGDFTASAIDINTLSEHNISSLSVGNTSEWVNKNLNTWVNGDSNTTINGQSLTSVAGGSTQTISPYSLTNIIGSNDTLVTGNNSSFVVGLNTSFVLGLNLGMMLGGTLSYTNPYSVQFFSGMNMQLTAGMCVQIAANNVQNYGVNMQHNGVNCSWDDTTVAVKAGAEMKVAEFIAQHSNLLLLM